MTEPRAGKHPPLAARLLAEFLVIVAGVLAALTADAAWDAKAERRQEERYYVALLHDLAADTAEYAIALRMTGRSLETASLSNEAVENVQVDERALAETIRGDSALLRQTELMILEWESLVMFYEEQVAEAGGVLDLLERRIGRGSARAS